MFTQYWRQCPKNVFPPFLNILPSWPRATAVAIKSHLTASLNTGCSLKLLSHGLQIYSSTRSPVNKLLDHLHSTVELIKSQDVLLSEETQTRALPEILAATAKSRVGNVSSETQNWMMNKGYAEIKSFLILISYCIQITALVLFLLNHHFYLLLKLLLMNQGLVQDFMDTCGNFTWQFIHSCVLNSHRTEDSRRI